DPARRVEDPGRGPARQRTVHRHASHEEAPGARDMRRLSYDGVVAAAPITVPYVRYSVVSAHWWLGRALRALVQNAGIEKRDIDGMCVSSFTLAPDTAVGLTQHLGMSPRWLDHIPMGGA